MSAKSTPTTRRLKSQTPQTEEYPITHDFLKKGTLPTGPVAKKTKKR